MFFSTGHFFPWIIRCISVLESSLKNLGLVNKVFTQQPFLYLCTDHSRFVWFYIILPFTVFMMMRVSWSIWFSFVNTQCFVRCILQKLSGKLTAYFNASTSAGYYFYLVVSSASLNENTSAKLDYFKQSLVVTSCIFVFRGNAVF